MIGLVNDVMSVSYTHLDVYKRQVKRHTDLLNPSEFVKQINLLELYNNCLKLGDVVSVNFFIECCGRNLKFICS